MPRAILVYDDDLIHHPSFLGELPAALSALDLGDVELIYRAHADDAVSEVQTLGPLAVLMDYSMGRNHLTGAQAVSTLREHFDADALPIVGISSEPAANEWIRMAGANDAVVKGAAPSVLPAMLKRVVHGGDPS